MMKVALYARVSTDDKDQNPETQLQHLRKIAEAHEYTIIEEYVDRASGRTVRGRPNYARMLEDAKKRRFQAIMAFKLDRLHRNLIEAVHFVDSLRLLKIDLIITTEAFDTTTAVGRMAMQFTAMLAELESSRISERVKPGMERAKAEGRLYHRPKKVLTSYQLDKARAILDADPDISHRKLAEQFTGISRNTLIRLLRAEGVL